MFAFCKHSLTINQKIIIMKKAFYPPTKNHFVSKGTLFFCNIKNYFFYVS